MFDRHFLDILESSRTLPFSNLEVRVAMEAVNVRRSQGADLLIGHSVLCEGPQDVIGAAQSGVVFFNSPIQLGTAFMFIKLDAGRGLFGGQKAVFASYLATDHLSDQWDAGVTFKSWLTATTSIGNVYRGVGLR